MDYSAQLIAAGWAFGCAVVSNGVVECWGGDAYGPLPMPVPGLDGGVQAITAGAGHACAVVHGGAWCWGSNDHGQLGDSTTTASTLPVQVTGLASGVQALSAGGEHTCALVNGGVWCWGGNSSGQLGDGSTTDRHVPTQVVDATGVPISGVTAIAAGIAYYGAAHSCAVVKGAIQCWGNNDLGQLGDGTRNASHVPVQVMGLTSGGQEIATGKEFSCGVINGGVRCWGSNLGGALGSGTIEPCGGSPGCYSLTPVQVEGLTSGVGDVVAGDASACAIVDGGVQCWGYDDGGRLPFPVPGLTSGVQAIAHGYFHACAIVNDWLECWGSNGSGELGNGTSEPRSDEPVPVQL